MRSSRLVISLCVLLVACGGETVPGAVATDSTPAAESVSTTSATPPTTVALTPPSTISTSTSLGGSEDGDGAGSVASAGEDCLVGTWEVGPDAWESTIVGVFAGSGLEADVEVSGGASLIISADGSYEGAYEDLSASVTPGIEGVPPIEVSFSGAAAGVWSSDGSQVTFEPTSQDALEISLTVGGVPFEGLPIDGADLDVFADVEAAYTCSADTLSFEVQVENGPSYVATRVG